MDLQQAPGSGVALEVGQQIDLHQAHLQMRQTATKVYGGLVDRREAERLERLAEGLSQQAPPWAAQYISKAAPVVGVCGAVSQAIGPRIYSFYVCLYRIYKRLPKNAASCLWGFGLCFFGGRYPLSLAVIEAWKLTGGSDVAMHLHTLKETVEEVQKAEARDSTQDANRDGVPDVDQESPRQMAARKVALWLRIADPGEVSEALRGVWSGYLGIIAALQTKFARTTALAHSIGESFRPAAAKILGPSALSLTPVEYRKWVSPGINYFCKFLAAAVAWRLQTTISTFQSGLAGGLLAARSGMALLQSAGYLAQGELGDTLSDEVVGWTLAAGGVYYQLVQGGTPPIIFAPVLWPLGFLESWLKLCVSVHR